MHRECALYTVLPAPIRKENILEKFHPIIFFAYSGCIVNKQQQRQQRRSAFTDRSWADAAFFSFLIFTWLIRVVIRGYLRNIISIDCVVI